jgi:hypothetical protein
VWQIPDTVDTVVCAPDDGWKYHPKHVEQFPDINKLCNVASCWIYIWILLRDYPILHISRIRVNITENIGFSVVSVDMQMSSDMDLVTFGLCVHVATTAAEQSSYYTILTSQFCSSSTHTGSAIWSFICVQLHRYIITLCQETDMTSQTQTSQLDSIISSVEFTTL